MEKKREKPGLYSLLVMEMTHEDVHELRNPFLRSWLVTYYLREALVVPKPRLLPRQLPGYEIKAVRGDI